MICYKTLQNRGGKGQLNIIECRQDGASIDKTVTITDNGELYIVIDYTYNIYGYIYLYFNDNNFFSRSDGSKGLLKWTLSAHIGDRLRYKVSTNGILLIAQVI